ncbi:hypothetical protein L6Q96_04175 [Candidatus Binatia bacterium]|nr:hypothetical protein [Candidatus Binatia bacterium]
MGSTARTTSVSDHRQHVPLPVANVPARLRTAVADGRLVSSPQRTSPVAHGRRGWASRQFPLVIDPVAPTTLYAGTSGGVFESTNAGAAWVPASAKRDLGQLASEIARALAERAAIGVIEAAHALNRTGFTEDDLALLDALATTIAAAIGSMHHDPAPRDAGRTSEYGSYVNCPACASYPPWAQPPS